MLSVLPKKLLIFSISLILASFFYSCNKCPEKKVGEYRFTSEELQINPYNGNEGLLFKNLTGDSVSLTVGDRSSGMIKVFTIYVDDGECNGNYTLVETNNTVISSNDDSLQFTIFLRFFPEPSVPGFYKSMRVEAKIQDLNKKTISSVSVTFEQDKITGYDSGSGSNEDLLFHKSLTLGAKHFSDVYEFEVHLWSQTGNNWVSKMYYSIQQGIVGFSTHQNELWYLVN